ncbi:DUF3054 domain-containing protein [Sciscionella sediminilitoris]|uniref:DUF3054 domain-containing protein n=1 Tax=Sciscionella sediminilitoris TaxID=1445613 RepID=UPI0004DF9784|nr:DUF3054 domain-containing protein [Sciscionella sp. SE31]
MSPRTVLSAAVLDVLVVLVFVVIGRSSHAEGITVSGIAETLWPFLAGTVIGWVACLAWRAPISVPRTGVPVWLATLVLGMVLRVVSGQGTEVSFIIVAGIFLGVFLLGWRAIAVLLTRRRKPLNP